ncbi:MAG: hypothetical protein JW860_02910 [Sedimentisphaerales bacterium]|nr:hypothetical protein [Sedimentisphaerales bacterium]
MTRAVLYGIMLITTISHPLSAQNENPAAKPPVLKGPKILVLATEKKCPEELSSLLENLEAAGGKMKSFQADMIFRQEDLMHETLTLRNGRLYYQVDKDIIKARIHFKDFRQEDLEDPDLAQTVKFDEDYAFDGQWVTRRNERTKTLQMWEVSKDPRNKEAFRLGRGPFPLPFAIRKADVLQHFEVELLKPDENMPQSNHLKLIPKKDSTYAEEYVRIELWIQKETSIPIQISFEKDDYEITTVTWIKPTLDKNIKDSQFKLKPAGNDWTIEKSPMEEPSEEPEKT